MMMGVLVVPMGMRTLMMPKGTVSKAEIQKQGEDKCRSKNEGEKAGVGHFVEGIKKNPGMAED